MRSDSFTRKAIPTYYRHYGAEFFDPDKFTEVLNRDKEAGWVKPMPHTGFWASPVDSSRSWKEWCENNEFCTDRLSSSFVFMMKNPQKVFYIHNGPTYEKFVKLYGIRNPFGTYEYNTYNIDFEKMRKDGWEGLEISISSWPRLYDLFYGWDCDSILVLRQDAIEEVSYDEFYSTLDLTQGEDMGDDVLSEWDAAICNNEFS